jgi:predicted DNA-binding protein with PD1-like motif
MKHKLLNPAPERTYAVVLDVDDDPVECLTEFARAEHLDAARFTAIGAFSEVVLGFFDLATKDYAKMAITEQTEVVSLVGDVALGPDGAPKLHAHVVVARRDASAWGGHLVSARVQPTLEVMLVESPTHLQRRIDAATGLALIAL